MEGLRFTSGFWHRAAQKNQRSNSSCRTSWIPALSMYLIRVSSVTDQELAYAWVLDARLRVWKGLRRLERRLVYPSD